MNELKPCPFCGGEARRIDIDATKPSVPDAGASYIACGRCYACSPIMFGEKTGLEESWNRRAISTIGPEAIRPSEDTEKLCHQIYDVLPISPALKLLDDGKLYALITAHDEAIRRECARAARNAIFDFGIGNKASNYYSPIIRKELAVQLVERAILGAEPETEDTP